jgi:putative transposase
MCKYVLFVVERRLERGVLQRLVEPRDRAGQLAGLEERTCTNSRPAWSAEHGTIVIEGLNVAGMLRNRRLARRIAGVGMAELRRQFTYKTGWASARLHVADRWFPSSKTCSACGVVKAKPRLSERTYRCDQCGNALDRDLNAARNLAALVEQVIGGTSSPSCGATQNEPDGNPQQTHTVWAADTATGRATRSTSARQRTDSGHVFTRFLNGQ